MKYLGIDYGTKRIGIAVSNDEGTLAFPHMTVENNSKIVDQITAIATELGIAAFVIGESLQGNGQENIINLKIKKIAEKIKTHSEKPVFFQNEWGSSGAAAAHQYGKGNIANKKWTGKENAKKREHNDANAATIILQRFLDRQRLKNNE